MVYLISSKFLDKNIMKMLIQRDYYLIDGDNTMTTGRQPGDNVSVASKQTGMLSNKYNKARYMDGFCPSTSLYELLRRQDRYLRYEDDMPVDDRAFSAECFYFFDSRRFISAVIRTYRAMVESADQGDYRNFFIVLPPLAFRYLGDSYSSAIANLMGGDYFIQHQSVMRNNIQDVLARSYTEGDMDHIMNRCDELERLHEPDKYIRR